MRADSFGPVMLTSATLGAAAFLFGWLNNREEYAAFWIIVGACGLRMLMPLILPSRFAAMLFANDVMLMCLGFVLGFWIARGRWWYTHAVVNWTVLAWTLYVALGTPIAWGLNRWTLSRRITGPYCRGCRYHLKGVAKRRCPECGRPFTLKELGVSEAELRADV